MDEKKIKDFKISDDLSLFFDDFIKKGVTTKEEEVVPGLKVKLKVLDTNELLSAESIVFATSKVPADIVVKVRCASILSQSILSINGMEIDKEGDTEEEKRGRRSALYRKLLEMSAYVLQKTYDLYIEAAKEQMEFYSGGLKEIDETIENF